ncbi:MAG: NapH/MauN family ferredoxin-type protein [Deltaproteobacteria bacterium]|nr:NapH/MauN family ferredoxin-type protein [Deltaproteobacteria bacterium]
MRGPGKRTQTLRKEGVHIHSIRNIRWAVLIGINLLFFLSYYADIQVLEGTLSGSRLLGFHLADPYATMQIALATQHVPVNLVIGTLTIGGFYLLFGGRTFCSWVCPYHLLAELADKLRDRLSAAKKVKNRNFDYKLKYVIWLLFLVLALGSGYTIYETFSPPGLLTRFFVYGSWAGMFIILALLIIEVMYSKRFWCRYICPVGTTYNFIGRISPFKIKWDQQSCSNCKECQKVCMVPFVLADTVNRGQGEYVLSGECTRCGECVDACHDGALNFKMRYLDKII